ncbi:unnamed protein product [Effrenium voratum]|nr:unnamed protein product [Effrenium voratum]
MKRDVRLRVHAEKGAGIDLEPCEKGFRVEAVEDFPGQDLTVGDVIVEVNGTQLGGLSDEAMEEAFGSQFAEGARLIVTRA